MKRALIVGGIVTVMVGLGFVCPQLANLRESGSLIASQAALLGLGIAISVAGGFVGGQAARSLLVREKLS